MNRRELLRGLFPMLTGGAVTAATGVVVAAVPREVVLEKIVSPDGNYELHLGEDFEIRETEARRLGRQARDEEERKRLAVDPMYIYDAYEGRITRISDSSCQKITMGNLQLNKNYLKVKFKDD